MRGGGHGQLVLTVGGERPAMSISWEQPAGPYDSGFLVFFADTDPASDDSPTATVCLHCLVKEGDEQLGRGLDLAKLHGQVDYDADTDEWFLTDDQGGT
jgi:hypothetical protein